MLKNGEVAEHDDALTPEHSRFDLEETPIQHLADFLVKLGDDFAFVGWLRKLRINDSWFRVDCCFSTSASSAC
jgi:predicted nuclease of restriction endonuclease-like (RecB) superfamily